MSRPTLGGRWERIRRSRSARWAGVAVACYVTALVAVNLRSTAAAPVVNFVLPHVVGGSSLDDSAISTEWNLIQSNYVFRDVNGGLGTAGSEQGIVAALDQQFNDRFTAYLSRAQYEELRASLSGTRGGSIGIALEGRCANATPCGGGATPTELVIEDVLTQQPAARAGLRPGDVLVAVGSTPIAAAGDVSAALRRASSLIRGPAGTAVAITVRRGTQTLRVRVTRANLALPSVFHARFGAVLYLQVTGFDDGTGDAARDAIRAALSNGATSIVLDLRQDGGGFVAEAQELASQFLRPGAGSGDVVVRRGRLSAGGRPATAQTVIHDRIQPGGTALTQRLVVLVDGGTASAAEIVTAALADYHRATVVGVRTFGKGSVQLDYPLPGGADLHLTVERWFSPDGRSIDSAGITPMRTVALGSMDDRFRLDALSPPMASDPQLVAALSLLHG